MFNISKLTICMLSLSLTLFLGAISTVHATPEVLLASSGLDWATPEKVILATFSIILGLLGLIYESHRRSYIRELDYIHQQFSNLKGDIKSANDSMGRHTLKLWAAIKRLEDKVDKKTVDKDELVRITGPIKDVIDYLKSRERHG